MSDNLADYRKSYDKDSLDLNSSEKDPFVLFDHWFREVEDASGVDEVNAMTLSTIGIDGFPKSRVVLLKNYDNKGFIFYTNYNSEKGKAIQKDPHSCLSFFWPNMERQVVIKGIAEKVPEEQSTQYFHSRPKDSQLGAMVSPQSEVIPDRDYLENRLNDLKEEYKDQEVPRPDNWGGFLIRPKEFEFWQGRPNRLHDRIRYTIEDDKSWKMERLAP